MPVLAVVTRHEPLVRSLTAVYSHEHPNLPHVVTVETVGEAQTACAATLELVSFQHQPVVDMNVTLRFIANGCYEVWRLKNCEGWAVLDVFPYACTALYVNEKQSGQLQTNLEAYNLLFTDACIG